MDPILLSRIQFGLTAGFHFLFPPLTLGLTLIILIIETIRLKKKDEIYEEVSKFLVKILALVFVVGVATGITLEFSFGTNWSEYSRTVGDIFGAPLAAEGVFAFFLESVFIGVLVFGRNRVSQKVYWLSAFLVFFGSHLSGLWIIIANSWMQTPAGFALDPIANRAVLTDFFAAALNPSTAVRYLHVVIAGWITGSLFVAGIAAWYLIKGRFIEHAKPLLRAAAVVFIVASIVQLFSGHFHSVQVGDTQPEKMAAYEGLWETQAGAPLALFGVPDEAAEKTRLYVGAPKMLSLLIYFDADHVVEGLDHFDEDERPPVLLTFASYHIMIALGALFILMAAVGLILLGTKKIYTAKWYLRALLFAIPLPHFANEFGWIGAEVGRQPWAVYHVLRTVDAASVVVPGWQVLLTIFAFSAVYLLIFIAFLVILIKTVKQGFGEPAAAAGQ